MIRQSNINPDDLFNERIDRRVAIEISQELENTRFLHTYIENRYLACDETFNHENCCTCCRDPYWEGSMSEF